MNKEDFEKGKQVQDEIEKLTYRVRSLKQSLEGCSLSLQAKYTPRAGRGQNEIYLVSISKEDIKELIQKEIDATEGKIQLLEVEFKKI